MSDKANISWSNNTNDGMMVTITDTTVDTSSPIKGVQNHMVWEIGNPLSNMPETKKMSDKYKGNPNSSVVDGFAVSVIMVKNLGGIIEIFGWEPAEVGTKEYDVGIAVIKDICDTASETAVINWLNELVAINSNPTSTDADAITWMDKNCDTKLQKGNVYITLKSDNLSMQITPAI